ncbi:Zinc finger BED domain-containing protein RICESLEEPER 4 [Bienertia sinuspersici]
MKKQSKAPIVSQKSSHKRKNASPWWGHYSKTDDLNFAKCLCCKKFIGHSPNNGTKCLANHTTRCKMLHNSLDKKQKNMNLESQIVVNKEGTIETIKVSKPWIFNQEVARNAHSRMLIVDEPPFMFVKREGFRSFCKSMHLEFFIPSKKYYCKRLL